MCVYIYIHVSLSLSVYIYIYIYMYILNSTNSPEACDLRASEKMSMMAPIL